MDDRPEGRPDAVIFPEDVKEGVRASQRYMSLIVFAEILLQLDYHKGERAHVHRQGTNMCFATPTPGPKPAKCPHPLDTLMFAKDHPLADTNRHTWFHNPDGTQSGYLTEEAKRDMREYDEEIAAKKEASRETVEKMRKIMRGMYAQ